jgi:integrase
MLNVEKFYNGEIKVEYLNTIKHKDTRNLTAYPFITAGKTEKAFDKDLYDMNIDELGEVMKALAVSSANTAYNHTVKFEQYIDWAYENGHIGSNLNPLSNVNKLEWSKQFVATYKQSAFKRDEILTMCGELVNYVDQAVLLSLFEGISGEGFSELLNLRTKDLKEENGVFKATLYQKDGTFRTIEISELLFNLLHKTDYELEYINKNGFAENNRSNTSKFQESEFIFKKTTRGKQEGSLTGFYVNRKFVIYKELFDLKFLKSKDIQVSGMMHMADNLYNKNGKFGLEELKLIGDQFDTANNRSENGEYRNTNVIKLLLKTDLFKNLYGYEIIK